MSDILSDRVLVWRKSPYAWERAAARCYATGDFYPISSAGLLHRVRFWLSPIVGVNARAEPNSGDSMLLEWILAPDDDPALHDSPWPFRSSVLAGGVEEELPLESMINRGPHKTCFVQRFIGDTVEHAATELLRVNRVGIDADEDTWVLLLTGPTIREWGYWPAGEAFVPQRERGK